MSTGRKYNIALLGKSGAGKSTLVNGLANYLNYESFKEALQSDPVCIIPTKYYMQSASGQGYDIQLGIPDKNEVHVQGESCTQKPKIYQFSVGDAEYSFVDVPGIGDTRGTHMDAQNRKQVLGVLSTFPELHGILILLNTQDTRLTVEYKYCLTEILTMIHRDALDNIFFVFTNSSAQDFRGGQSLPLLQTFLQELKSSRNIAINLSPTKSFYIDNDGFRLQGFYNQHPDAVERRELTRSKKSWDHTRQEMYRLLDSVRKVKAHEVQNSISLNEARTVGVLLLEPLAAVTALNAQNTLNIDKSIDNMVNKVKTALQVVEYDIQIKQLKQPRTVCTAITCIGIMPMAGGYTTHYKQLCHNPCYLTNVALKTLPEPALRDCYAINGNNMCNACAANDHTCSYELHMHIDFEQHVVPHTTETRLTKDLKAASQASDQKAAMRKIMEELEKEQEIILQSVETFMAFLKEHSIFEHNEFFEKRLDVEIRNQEAIAQQTGKNNPVLDKLNAIKDKHKKDMEMVKKLPPGNVNVQSITAYDIVELRDKCFNLKYNGPKIDMIYKTTSGKVLENARKKCVTEIEID